MSTKPFQFKQFKIEQNNTAMKVGTDGVLLGAWVDISSNPNSILDIGTGTGLIALQLAQRTYAELIDAVEIEPDAFEQAVQNFENSAWSDRLFCYHASIQEFSNEIDIKYDLIVSNPPFYNDTFKVLETKRANARHTGKLSFDELILATSRLLHKEGNCFFILPFKEEEKFLKIAHKNSLFPSKITRVKGNTKNKSKRSLIQLGFEQIKTQIEELVLEKERHHYTEEYKKLVKEFYLFL